MIIDTRQDTHAVRRRRRCEACSYRWSTYETTTKPVSVHATKLKAASVGRKTGAHEWTVRVKVWPYFGTAQQDVGDERRVFHLSANTFHEAVAAVELLVDGIKTNPKVWQVPITEISQRENQQ